ncbi:MAG TPA: type II toxin-antitoxin system HicB family antitoxin [Candidatus Eremiobacteraceae bacterium]|nr:type II toxin-antitoxin system HicB family antitoxin [Candidatus Eremiobacteraceae bacterium]
MSGTLSEVHVTLTADSEGGFVVTVDEFPEIATEGDTLEEAIANAKEAIQLVVTQRVADGSFGTAKPAPTPRVEIARLEVAI